MPLTQLQATGQPFPPGEPDVQRTSFSLDVLGRFVCSTYDEATTNPDFDVVVIGSGMYGSYAAAKIYSESAKSAGPRCASSCSRRGRFSSTSTARTSPISGSATRSAR